jgi:hypothetical protein
MSLLYVVGWIRIRRRNPQLKLANKWRLFSYLSGIFLVAAMLLAMNRRRRPVLAQ